MTTTVDTGSEECPGRRDLTGYPTPPLGSSGVIVSPTPVLYQTHMIVYQILWVGRMCTRHTPVLYLVHIRPTHTILGSPKVNRYLLEP